MRKIANAIAVVILLILCGYIGWRSWKSCQCRQAIGESSVVVNDIPEQPLFDSSKEAYRDWNQLSWYGKKITQTQAKHWQDVFEKQLETPSFREIFFPEYSMYIKDAANDHYDSRPATVFLEMNGLLCSTGRKNDHILSLYSYLRQFKNLMTPRLTRYARLLYQSYKMYCPGNDTVDQALLQKTYEALSKNGTRTRTITDKLKTVLDVSLMKKLKEEGYRTDEIEWACSFWPRRASERNIAALYEIVKDLYSSKEEDNLSGFDPNSLLNDTVATGADGIRAYQSFYADGKLRCIYSFDGNGNRQGRWVYKPSNSEDSVECHMYNDMLHGNYVVMHRNRYTRYSFSNDQLRSKAFYRDRRLVYEAAYIQGHKNRHIDYSYYPSGSLYKVDTWVKDQMTSSVTYNEDGSSQLEYN